MELAQAHPNLEPVLKLKCYDPEHFETLCKMHLSFLLDLHDDEFSNLLEDIPPETKTKKTFSYFKKSKTAKQVMDGAPLTQEGICQVYQLIQHLNSNLNVEGLFRKSGSLNRQQELKALLNLGQEVELGKGKFSAHDCAGVLKGFLAALPEPLLPHWRLHLGLCEGEPRRRLQAVGLLVLLLPPAHLGLLHDLLRLLHRAATQASPHHLDARGLATLFAPHLLLPRMLCPESLQSHFPQLVDAMVFLISNAQRLFDPSPEFLEDISSHLKSHAESLLGSPAHTLEPVSTVVSFCQHAATDSADFTQQAVAQLYAQIQSLPDSSRKRRLLRQVNKENRPRQHRRSKSLGVVLRRRLYRTTPLKAKDDSLLCSDSPHGSEVALLKSSPLPTPPLTPKALPGSPPKKSSHGTPFSRTLTRASKRVKAVVMPPRNKTPITT